MKDAFIKYCEQIKFEITKDLSGSIINDVSLIEKKDGEFVSFNVSFFSVPTKEQLKSFVDGTVSFFKNTHVNFNISFLNKNFSNEKLYDIFYFGISYLLNKNPEEFISKNQFNFDVNNNELTIIFNSIIDHKKFNESIKYKQIVSFFNLTDLKVNIINNSNFNFEEKVKQAYETNEIEFYKSLDEKKKHTKVSENNNRREYTNNRNKKTFKVSLQEFYETQEINLLVEGKIFEIDEVITKTKLTIITFYITDEEEAIAAKYYIREGEENKYSWPKIGQYVSITGEKKQDNSSLHYLNIKQMEQIKKDEVKDLSKDKRIEFSARTSMSSMDGFTEPSELLKYAKDLGHEAIGITDFHNIQAFPEIYNNAKKIGIKPIYGTTFSVISKKHNLIWNTKSNSEIKKEKYVIFDLETTSLNPRLGEIIEFGAVIVENLVIKDTIQFFIKPSQRISKFTTELTGITQNMLDTKSKFNNQKDAIIEIKKILSDATLVAHNAQFDIGFINEKLYQNGFDRLTNQIIDTMGIAKFLFPVSSSYRLEIISKKLGINYIPSIAHRADYDAKVLEQVWTNMITLLDQKNIFNFEQINSIDEKWLNEKKYGYDLNVYAKNQKGIKKLFKLVSTSHTTDYFNGPKLFEEDVKKDSDLLIGPASINSKLIDLMQTGTSYELEKEIKKWDFIGIPSPHLFSHLIARGNFDEEKLKTMLKELTLLAKKNNKIVIAIGDVRYPSTEDSIAHKIYINTKGLEGKRHWLYKYNELEPKYPIQKFLTTQEMIDQFDFLNSSELIHEIVIKNTQQLNSLIDNNIEIIKSKLYPPKFDNSDKNLIDLVYKNASNKYGDKLPEIIKKRIERELEPIIKYGFSVVYWISQKLVSKSLSDGYLVGSRGSVGSSIVATLSGITEVNPLPPHYICKKCKNTEFVIDATTTSGFDLPNKKCSKCNIDLLRDGQTIPFETFLGFDGDKVPDIDLNFSGDYQPTIHQEVKNLFGENHSFRAGTISTVASRTAYGFTKKYFEENNISKSNHYINYLSKKIEGSKRTTGQHPGGIIIIPKEFDVEDFTPINYPANDLSSAWKTTHFDFHAIHDNVLKLDLLGHDDPTVIRQLQKLTKVKMEDISFSDEKVMKLFSSTEPLGINSEDINGEMTGVLGIPEFGTKFVRRMLKTALPKTFNDLINISGLSHGTDVWSGNAEELIKQGKSLNEVISCRDDIMVYLMKKGVDQANSFQIMEKVRKGKGLSSEDEKLLTKKGIEKWYINSLNKIKYMFPKAHATAYVMMAWRIAWFKIYYPLEYYTSFFTVRTDVFDLENSIGSKLQIETKLKSLEKKQQSKEGLTPKEEDLISIFEIINEMKARNILISNIDLNNSEATEWKINYETNSLIPPFIVIDGLGEVAAKSIIEARKTKGFTSKEDLLRRTQINKTILEKMDKLGITMSLENTDQIKLF